jgi:two-component system CheB/CheR fusion protein
MGFSDLLLQTELSKEKIKSFVKIINSNSLQLLSIISDLIDISKIESGQVIIGSDLIDVNNLLNELFVTYKESVDLKKIDLSCSCKFSNEIIQIKSDENRIRQVLCNLLNNAIKFTKEGKIEFGVNIKKHFIEFFVIDTGIGIAPENQILIFDRFRQVDATSTRKYGGNGLGLSISKALVEKLGGYMTVHSELGKGSIFAFTIPYIKKKKSLLPYRLNQNLSFKSPS